MSHLRISVHELISLFINMSFDCYITSASTVASVLEKRLKFPANIFVQFVLVACFIIKENLFLRWVPHLNRF